LSSQDSNCNYKYKEGAFSLTGLTGAGSTPATILCAAILILFAALVAVKYYLLNPAKKRKDTPMKTQKRKTQNRLENRNKTVRKSLAIALWDVGTELVAGLSLLG
jgi:hypothetical protein